MYLSILTLSTGNPDTLRILQLLGLRERDVDELVRRIGELLEVSVEDYRVDLDPVARSLYGKVIEGFYEGVGYIVEGNPGSLKVMIAFMARLASDEVKALELGNIEDVKRLRVTQLRFLNTHLKPLLEGVIASNERLSKAARILLELIDKDIELLKDLLFKAKPSYNNSLLENVQGPPLEPTH